MVEVEVVLGVVERVVLGAMEDAELLVEEGVDKWFEMSGWVRLDWVGESGED